MKIKKVQHTLINGGKEFVPNKWTYKKHKQVMKELAKVEGKLSNEEKEVKFQNLVVLKALEGIDDNVTEADLEDVHPNDRIELWFALYSAGKEGVYVPDADDANFQKKKKKTCNNS